MKSHYILRDDSILTLGTLSKSSAIACVAALMRYSDNLRSKASDNSLIRERHIGNYFNENCIESNTLFLQTLIKEGKNITIPVNTNSNAILPYQGDNCLPIAEKTVNYIFDTLPPEDRNIGISAASIHFKTSYIFSYLFENILGDFNYKFDKASALKNYSSTSLLSGNVYDPYKFVNSVSKISERALPIATGTTVDCLLKLLSKKDITTLCTLIIKNRHVDTLVADLKRKSRGDLYTNIYYLTNSMLNVVNKEPNLLLEDFSFVKFTSEELNRESVKKHVYLQHSLNIFNKETLHKYPMHLIKSQDIFLNTIQKDILEFFNWFITEHIGIDALLASLKQTDDCEKEVKYSKNLETVVNDCLHDFYRTLTTDSNRYTVFSNISATERYPTA
jgi:hypothetical protein